MSEKDPTTSATQVTQVTRRGAIVGLGVVGLAACGSDDTTVGDTPPVTPAPTTTTPPSPPGPIDAAPPADAGADAAPAYTPKELLAGIDHIVVLMMENRSFDHFLGALKSDPGYAAKATVAGLAGTESNPAPDGTPVLVHKLDNFEVEDPPHGWDAMHNSFNGGANDNFVKQHAGSTQSDVMGFHDRSQIPLYYWFADNFAICDHWYASVLGPTWPNRFYLHATTSKGKKDNTPFLVGAPDTVWDRLKAKGCSYKNYAAGITTWYQGGFAGRLLAMNPSANINAFFSAAESGTLPDFCLIDPDFQASDDHPAHNIQRGQAFVASVYKALAASPTWSKTLFIITYDEAGGFFDHVPPPAAVDANPEFGNHGFRVPAIVIGPTVKKGYVCQKVLEHSSVAATLRTRFEIDSLSLRMDNASDISDCIDPAKINAPAPPPVGMPTTVMSLSTALNDGVGEHSQPMLEQMLRDGTITPVNETSHQARIGTWLTHAQKLGAVRIINH